MYVIRSTNCVLLGFILLRSGLVEVLGNSHHVNYWAMLEMMLVGAISFFIPALRGRSDGVLQILFSAALWLVRILLSLVS